MAEYYSGVWFVHVYLSGYALDLHHDVDDVEVPYCAQQIWYTFTFPLPVGKFYIVTCTRPVRPRSTMQVKFAL